MKRNAIRSKLLQMIIAFILIAALVGVYFTVLGASAVRTDEQLKAERATYVLLNYEKMKELARIERESEISDLFHKDEEEDISKAVLSYNIKGLDEAEDYILVTGAGNGGYAIYAKDNLELLEFSPFCGSPYKTVEKDKAYYGGPMSYYEKKNEVLKNIDTGEEITVEKANEIAASLKDVEQAIKQERVAEKQTEAEEVSQTKQKATRRIIGHDEDDLVYETHTYQVKNQKLITNYKYFKIGPEHHKNSDGTCVLVAMQLLLGYNNWANDGRLITNPEYLKGREIENNPNLLVPFSKDRMSTTEKFFERLKEVTTPSIFGYTNTDAGAGFNKYLQEDVDEVVANNVSAGAGPLDNFSIKAEIDNDRPVMASIVTSDGFHMTVAYGYQTLVIDDNDEFGYIIHYGHDKDKNYVWLKKNFFNGHTYFRVNHSHTDEVLESDSHVVKCAVCNRIKYNNQHIYNGKSEKISHRFHTTECKCGDKKSFLHENDYIAVNENIHSRVCVKCDYTINENHLFKQSRRNCYYCSYVKGV